MPIPQFSVCVSLSGYSKMCFMYLSLVNIFLIFIINNGKWTFWKGKVDDICSPMNILNNKIIGITFFLLTLQKESMTTKPFRPLLTILSL